jgi:DNA-3-methyladenine glycosylase I
MLSSVTTRAEKAAGAVAAEKSRSKARKPGAVLRVVTFVALDAFELAGSITAAQREHAAQVQRKMRIAHYGRTTSFSRVESKAQVTTHNSQDTKPYANCCLTLLC